MSKNELKNALHTIALAYSNHQISLDDLEKACNSYKDKIHFNDDFNYQMILSKTVIDFCKGREQDEELIKAIVPGQTKVKDGVLYVWSPTKAGSKNSYEWHVVDKNKKGGNIGKSSKMTDKELDAAMKLVNEGFPADFKDLKPVNKTLGGSTGAKLMEDSQGRQFITKESTANKGFIEAEYFANQLYDLMGLRAKDSQLYDEGNKTVMVSKFVQRLDNVNPNDYAKMAQGFMMDVLLANWDVYKNDNCRKDVSGNIVRVDNGGSFDYKARGGIDNNKFTEDIEKTFKGMVNFNQSVYSTLSNDDVLKQIDEIKKKKDDIVGFLRMSGKDEYADIMEKRITNLDKIAKSLKQKTDDIEKIPIPKRKIKSKKDMYRVMSDKELNDIRKQLSKETGKSAYDTTLIADKKNQGWELLARICHERGFDGLPQVVTDDEFWKIANKDNIFFRGVGDTNDGKMSSTDIVINTFFEDKCYYGTMGTYGQGIYVGTNHYNANRFGKRNTDSGKNDYKNSYAWSDIAADYARSNGYGHPTVMKGCLAPDATIVDYKDILAEVQNLTILAPELSDDEKQEIDDLQKEIDVIKDDVKALRDKIDDKVNNFQEEVYKDFNFNKQKWKDFNDKLKNINWDKKDINSDPDVPDFHDVVEGILVPELKELGFKIDHMRGWYKATMTVDDRDYSVEMGADTFLNQWALKRKGLNPSYNVTVERVRDFIENTYMRKLNDAIEEKRNDPKRKSEIQSMQTTLSKRQSELKKKEDELSDITTSGMNENDNFYYLLKTRCQHGDGLVGLYAAAKGIDAIRVDNGYTCVLNRTKMIFNNKVDRI